MLSRLFLRALHRDLTRFVVARGEPGGPDLWSAALAVPARLRYYAGRVAVRMGKPAAKSYVQPERYRQFAPRWEEILVNILRPEAAAAITSSPLAAHPQVLGRLVALAHVNASLRPPAA